MTTSALAEEAKKRVKGFGGSASPVALLSGVVLFTLLGVWTLHLLPQWLHNPDLSHGLFTPLVFILLLHEARTTGIRRYLRTSHLLVGLVGLISAISLVLLAMSGLYAAALEWTHPLVEFLLGAALCGLLTASWLTASLDRVGLIPFNWPAAVGVLVWALSAPIPPGTYTRLTQQLQSQVTSSVLFTLNLLGIAATQDGNVIDLAHTSVGVEEACSGIRSLLSCIFAGFFLSAVLVRRPWKRTLIIALSAPLAIAMNFIRSLFLTLLANAGVDIHGRWHDLTGFGILAATALLLAGIALGLERPEPRNSTERHEKVDTIIEQPALETQEDPPPPIRSRSPVSGPEWILLSTLLFSLAILGVFIGRTRPSRDQKASAPNLWAMLPEKPENWEVTTRTDLYRFTSQLQTKILAERTYTRTDERGALQVTVYLAYWSPGQASVSLVETHTPDACWPGSGWIEDRAAHRLISLPFGSNHLPEAQFRAFKLDTFPQKVWYWHLFDGKPVEAAVGSPRQLLSLAWNYGFRDEAEQVFVRISSNRSWEEIANEPLLGEIISRLHPLGL